MLSELRDRLLAGEVWVTGSRRHRSFEERLLSRETVEELRQAGTLPVTIEMDFDKFIESRRSLLDKRMVTVDARARDYLLPGVTITKGVLKIAPIEKSTPPEAEALAARLYAMLPRIRVADLLAEVAGWTRFPEYFTHLRTGETAADNRVLMAGLLAEGLNLGLMRMAEACSIASLGQLAWTSDWHIREETYALALRCLVNQQQREPFAATFGGGIASSSDGQFFQAGGLGRDAGQLNVHYGQKPGFKAYTHLSDRYGPYFTKLIGATASEALHVLDALLYRLSDVEIRRHHTDGGGESDHVFALCTLLGFQFAPHSEPEAPASLLLWKAVRLSAARTPDRRADQCRVDPRPLVGDPAHRRVDPHWYGDRLADHAAARVTPAAEWDRGGLARVGAAGTHVVHS